MNQATELEYLQYFYSQADFGPADDDVRYYIEEAFKRDTGLLLPNGYARDEEEEE